MAYSVGHQPRRFEFDALAMIVCGRGSLTIPRCALCEGQTTPFFVMGQTREDETGSKRAPSKTPPNCPRQMLVFFAP